MMRAVGRIGFEFQSLGFRVSEFRLSEFRVQGLRVSGLGFKYG